MITTVAPAVRRVGRGAGSRGALGRLALAAVPVGFLVVFVAWPIVAIARRTAGELGAGRLAEVLTSGRFVDALVATVGQTVVSVIATIVVGLPIAAAIARHEFRGRGLLRAVVLVPFVLPTLVVATAVDQLGLLSGWAAVVAAHVVFNVAIVVRLVGGWWAGIDRRRIEAAATLGASPAEVFRTITFPLLRPAVLAAAAMIGLFSFTSFGVILVLGGPARFTIETDIHRFAIFRGELDVAAVLGGVQLVTVAAFAVVAARLQRRVSVARRGRRVPLARPVRTGADRLLVAVATSLVGLVVVVPLGSLVVGSFRVGGGFGLTHWRALAQDPPVGATRSLDALVTSLTFAAGAAVIALVVGALAAIVIARGDRLGRVVEVVGLIPIGVSAVTLGFGYLLAFTAFDFRRSIWLVPVAHAVIGVPFVIGAAVPALRSVDQRRRDAVAALGGSPWRVWLDSDARALVPALRTATGFAAAVSLGEFGATTFLSRPQGSETAPVVMFKLLSRPGDLLQGQAMALAVALALLVAVIALVVDRRRGDGIGWL